MGLWVAPDQHLPSSLVLVKNYTQDVCLAPVLLGGEIIVLLSSFQDTILHNSLTHINDLFALSLRYATFQNYFKSRITLIVITRDVHFLSNIRNFGVLILTSKISPRYCLREIYRSDWRQRTICDSLQFNN